MQKMLIPLLVTLLVATACVRQESTPERAPDASPSAKSTVLTTVAGDGLATPLALSQTWQMSPGLLRGQLENWAATAGYSVVWKVSRDYHMQTAATFNGTFVEALQQLFTGMQKLGNSFKITVYHGNFVVVVSEE